MWPVLLVPLFALNTQSLLALLRCGRLVKLLAGAHCGSRVHTLRDFSSVDKPCGSSKLQLSLIKFMEQTEVLGAAYSWLSYYWTRWNCFARWLERAVLADTSVRRLQEELVAVGVVLMIHWLLFDVERGVVCRCSMSQPLLPSVELWSDITCLD